MASSATKGGYLQQILESDGTRFGAYQIVRSWLKQHQDIHTLSATAIFCFSDYVACGVYSAFFKCGLQCC